MECRFEELDAGSWFLYDEDIYVKDDVKCSVRFSDGKHCWLRTNPVVTFIKSVELIYE